MSGSQHQNIPHLAGQSGVKDPYVAVRKLFCGNRFISQPIVPGMECGLAAHDIEFEQVGDRIFRTGLIIEMQVSVDDPPRKNAGRDNSPLRR
mgnify:CR=1 FL=1